MYYEYDDAGHRRITKDCVARAIAIALDKPYSSVCRGLNTYAAKLHMPCQPSCGVRRKTYEAYLERYGWVYTPVLTVRRYRVSLSPVSIEDGILERGRFIVRAPGHMVAVVDGCVRDTFDSRQYRALGFFYKPNRDLFAVSHPGMRENA